MPPLVMQQVVLLVILEITPAVQMEDSSIAVPRLVMLVTLLVSHAVDQQTTTVLHVFLRAI